MLTFLLDNGHGIETPGKRSPLVPPGVHEWRFNRQIVNKIYYWAKCYDGANWVARLNPSSSARSLKSICNTANTFDPAETILLSVHANASRPTKNVWGTASGTTTFVAKRCSETSKLFAKDLARVVSRVGHFKNRGVKQKNFYVLKHTRCPAVLLETGFMTHPDDATKLASDYWQEQIAKSIFDLMRGYARVWLRDRKELRCLYV